MPQKKKPVSSGGEGVNDFQMAVSSFFHAFGITNILFSGAEKVFPNILLSEAWHAWAPRSKDFASVVLPRRLDIATEDPDMLDQMSFENAVEKTCSYWTGQLFDGLDDLLKPYCKPKKDKKAKRDLMPICP